jgi:uncharacterized small protein (TIGR04563 family)
MAKSDSGKRTVYFDVIILDEMRREAARLDRSLSWVAQRAWRTALALRPKLAERVRASKGSAPRPPRQSGPAPSGEQ